MRVERIDIAECRLALPRELRLGSTVIRTRDVVALRLVTHDGLAGEAVGYTRGTPLVAALRAVAPRVIGAAPECRSAVFASLVDTNVPGRAALMRAASLVEIALWDLAAKAVDLPLYALLGGLRDTVPVTLVAGYYADCRTIADLGEEVARFAGRGVQRVKVMLKGDDLDFDRRYLDAACAAAPGRIAADAHWSWRTLPQARAYARALDGYGLHFLEDPFAAEQWPHACALADTIATPLALGEDMAGAAAFAAVAPRIGWLRVDATTCGGVERALTATAIAEGAGCAVLPHVFASHHLHLACVRANVDGVEIIPAETGTDPLDRIGISAPAVAEGLARADERPGAGFTCDWDAIARVAADSASITA